MLRSIRDNWKQVIGFAVAATTIPVQELKTILNELITKCFSIGLFVKGLVCDQGKTNQSLYKCLGVTTDQPYYMLQNHKIICIYDVPHLIKSIRNNFINYDLQIGEGEASKVVSWNVIRQLYKIDSSSFIRLVPKLTPMHIQPNNFPKMKVSYAVQIFSSSAAAGLRTMEQLKLFTPEASKIANDTADFLKQVNEIFDMLNSRTLYSKTSKTGALQNTDNSKLEQYMLYLRDLKFLTFNRPTYISCINGLIQTIKGNY